MSGRLIPPDGSSPAPALDGAGFARLLTVLANQGAVSTLPAAAEAYEAELPLVVLDLPEVFAAGAAIRPQFGRAAPALRRRQVTFRLASRGPVVVDPGDGTPPQSVEPGGTVTARYPEAALAELTVSREGRLARCRLSISDDPAPPPADHLTLAGGSVWTLPAPGHAALRCPLVVVEGFPGAHGFLYSHDIVAQHGMLPALQALGHDLVVVGLDDGTRPLAENAAVLRAALQEIARRTPLPITLVGWSMGGLLARLAVAAMEQDGEEHHVETLVSWDTPHRGTMTQLGVQWFVAQFARVYPALAAQARLLASAANREMDMLVVGSDGQAAPDPRRAALVAELRWPQRPRRLLVASGRADGVCTVAPGRVLVHWRSGEANAACLRALGGDEPVATGVRAGEALAPLAVADEPPWDGMPGGREAYPAQVATLLADLHGGEIGPPHPPSTCTVPTVSALDLELPPDAPIPADPHLIACTEDQPHVGVDAEAAGRLIAALGAPFDPDRFNPADPAFLADPFPTYARFRQYAPVHTVAAYESLWCFTAADSRAILESTDVWLKHPPGVSPSPPGPMAAVAALPPGLFSSDPPAHRALRQAVEGPLTQAMSQVPRMVSERAQQLLAGIAPGERIELVQDYALPLPAGVLFDVLGLDPDPILRQALIAWQQAIAVAHDPTVSIMSRMQGVTCGMALRAFFAGLIERHRRSAGIGLLAGVCDAFAEAGLGDAELQATLCDLLIAGYLSTTFLIATGMWRLLGFPGALARLRAQPESMAAVVDELLRLDGPVQVIDRYACTPTTLAGRQLDAGTRVTAVVGSADRDSACFEAPEELRTDRSARSMAFGAGVHHCVGAPLARVVAPLALQALLEGTETIESDGEPQWQSDPYLRAVISLPLRVKFTGRTP